MRIREISNTVKRGTHQIFSSVVIALSSFGCMIPAAFHRTAREVTIKAKGFHSFIPALLNCSVGHNEVTVSDWQARRLTMTSSLPKVSTALSTKPLTSLSLPTSTLTATAFMSGDCDAIIPIARSAAAKLMSPKTTLAPSAANSRLDSRPIPLKRTKERDRLSGLWRKRKHTTYDPAPVIIATWRHPRESTGITEYH